VRKAEFDVAAAGHLCLDMIPRFRTDRESTNISDLLQPGTLVQMGEMTFSTGGAVSNVGIAMKIFGCTVAFIAKVGGDAIGKTIIEQLDQSGSARGIAVAGDEASSYTVILSAPGIDRIFMHYPGTNDTFRAEDVDMEAVGKSRLFHLGYPTLMHSLFVDEGRELTRILKSVKRAGVTTSLDISLPDPGSEAGRADWRKIYERALPYVDIFLPSIEEILFTLHPREYLERKKARGGQELIDFVSPEELSGFAEQLLSLGCAIAGVKAGHNGCYIRTAGRDRICEMGRAAPGDPASWATRELWCPAFRTDKIIGATGAGDSSIAAFLTALLRGHRIEESLKLANCAGFLNLHAPDTLSGLVSWEELQRIYPFLTERDTIPLPQGWRWEAKLKIWEREPRRC
jgi:sugar/nucleoside kinase (ribokinase family)